MSFDYPALPCSFCEALAKALCAICYEPYCSLICQARDWHKHKFVCRSMPTLVKFCKLVKKFERMQKISVLSETNTNFYKSNYKVIKTKQKYTTCELQVIPLRLGHRWLIVTDSSQLKNQLLAVVDFENSKLSDYNLRKLTLHCENVANERFGYHPAISELCLAIYDGDGMWYRAYCIEGPKYGKFMLQFVDFGNVAFVKTENIMPLNEELMFPSCTHLCYVTNIQRAHVNKFRSYIKKCPKVRGFISYNKLENFYEITITKLENILQ